jgi:hypothetical protein
MAADAVESEEGHQNTKNLHADENVRPSLSHLRYNLPFDEFIASGL